MLRNARHRRRLDDTLDCDRVQHRVEACVQPSGAVCANLVGYLRCSSALKTAQRSRTRARTQSDARLTERHQIQPSQPTYGNTKWDWPNKFGHSPVLHPMPENGNKLNVPIS